MGPGISPDGKKSPETSDTSGMTLPEVPSGEELPVLAKKESLEVAEVATTSTNRFAALRNKIRSLGVG
jgi:hypothetical protein